MPPTIQRTDVPVDVAVDAFLGNGALASCPAALRLVEMFVVQAELHCTQNNIERLKYDMFLGVNLGNLVLLNLYAGVSKTFPLTQAGDKSFE